MFVNARHKHAHALFFFSSSSSSSVEQLSSFAELAGNIDKLQLPSQLAAVFNNKFLQHLVSAWPSSAVLERLTHWLAVRLLDGEAT